VACEVNGGKLAKFSHLTRNQSTAVTGIASVYRQHIQEKENYKTTNACDINFTNNS